MRTTEAGVSEPWKPRYAGLAIRKDGFAITFFDEEQRRTSEFVHASLSELYEKAKHYLSEHQFHHKKKIVALGITGGAALQNERFGARIWLELDIVPHYFPSVETGTEQNSEAIAKEVAKKYVDGFVARVQFGGRRKVIPSHLALWKKLHGEASSEDIKLLEQLAHQAKTQKLKVVFFSSTPSGGGVALMRHALMRLYRSLGVDASWHVLNFKGEAFNVTKLKFHNVLQAIAPGGTVLTEDDKKVYNDWTAENAKYFLPVYCHADVVVIDDPQPSGLIPYIKKANPDVKIIYRSHIQIRADLLDKRGSSQWKTWAFLKKNIYDADLFISHPLQAFVPKDIPKEKIIFMPATTDPLDGLNKELSEKQMRHYGEIFNALLSENDQAPLDFKRPYIIQIARFDPSKGIPDVIEAYRRLRKKLDDLKKPEKEIPQLVIMGNGAIDDPEGSFILQETLFLLEMERYSPIAGDIKVVRVPHIDQLLNTLMRRGTIALQLSHREGFEVKVTEALHKGIPVIAYKTGGIPLQINDGVNGFLVKTGDTKKVAEHLYRLLTDKKLLEKMRHNAVTQTNQEYWTVRNAIRWLSLALRLHTEKNSAAQNMRQADRHLVKRAQSISS